MTSGPIQAFRRFARSNPFGGMAGTYEVLGVGASPDQDAAGYDLPGEPAVLNTYPGNFRTLTAEEKMQASQMSEVLSGVISLPHDAEVEAEQRLRDARTGVVYEISGVEYGEPELTVTVDCKVRRA